MDDLADQIQNELVIYIPSVHGMPVSVATTEVTFRTTLCDIMCTSTISHEYIENSGEQKKFSKTLNVNLPYKKISSFDEIYPGITGQQRMKAAEGRVKRSKLLKEERNEYMRRMANDRADKLCRETLGAIKIQSIYRGYRVRPKNYERRPPRGPQVLTKGELRMFLARLASNLSLKPIKGLTLSTTFNSSRQKKQIDHAGAFVLQRFFKMILQRSRARNRIEHLMQLKFVHARRAIRSFTVFAVKLHRKRKEVKAQMSRNATRIQTQIRMFIARRRY